MQRVCAALLLAAAAGMAAADEPDDSSALALPGAAPQSVPAARAWQAFVEGAAGRSTARDLASGRESAESAQRLSLDAQVDTALAPGLRLLLADRLDVNAVRGFEQPDEINTLKEAYLSWQPQPRLALDAGRVNLYSGVALGYNPTDFFRDGAVRSRVSVDPTSLKKNRQGSAMLRAQTVDEASSLTLAYSPRLADAPDHDGLALDFGATNARHRGLLVYSRRLGPDFNPQWLLFADEGQAPQFGVNLTHLVGDATVLYLEWAGGRSRSLLEQALGSPVAARWRQHASAGLTVTTADKLSLTAELQFNGAGLDRDDWLALPATSPQAYAAYREKALTTQEMVTRHALFLYASWQDALVNHLDATAMLRRNGDDHSRLVWLDLRYRWPRDELAWQWQAASGTPLSEFGAAAPLRAWQLSWRHYF